VSRSSTIIKKRILFIGNASATFAMKKGIKMGKIIEAAL
jgi:hypothetical protein